MSLRAMTLAFFLVAVTGPSVFANATPNAPGILQKVTLYGAEVTYPAPSWVQIEKETEAKAVLDQSETYRSEDRDQLILEQIPKGHSFSNWSNLFAVNAVRINDSVNFSLEGFVNGSFAPFIQYCGRAHFKMQPIEHNDDKIVALIFCQNSPLAKNGSGYGDGIGEIALFHFQRVGQTYVKVYEQWKGEAFTLDTEENWPVSIEQIKMMAARFESISIKPREK